MLHADIVLLIVFMAVMGLNYRSWRSFLKQHDIANSPHVYCMVSMSVKLVALLFDFWYHLDYGYGGHDNVILYIFGQIIDMASECMMILLLMMIANGWMTSWVKYDFDGGFETYAPLMIIIVAVHMVFAALGIVDRDAHHKFHDFSGWLGYSFVIFKFLLIGVYYYFY